MDAVQVAQAAGAAAVVLFTVLWLRVRASRNRIFVCPDELLTKDLSGKIIIVTGGNSGIGKGAAAQLVKQGATVVLACRSMEAAEAAAVDISAGAAGTVDPMRLDLSSLKSVHAFADAFQAKYDHLDVLVNNAGIMAMPHHRETEDGFEMQIGVCHLGHFLLTELLIEMLYKSKDARVICTSSGYHKKCNGHIDFEDMHFKVRKYNKWVAYGQAKLANILHAKELARRYASNHVRAYTLCPGPVTTSLRRHTPIAGSKIADAVLKFMGELEPWYGIQTTLYPILEDHHKLEVGAYYKQEAGMLMGRGGLPAQPSREACDEAVAEKLWEVSERLVGLVQ